MFDVCYIVSMYIIIHKTNDNNNNNNTNTNHYHYNPVVLYVNIT